MEPHPIRIVVRDDLRRSRLTVFFRLLLAIPHLVWLVLWTIAAFFATIANWVATLVSGTSPNALHRFLSAYLRYGTHLGAYLYLAANPYPGFTGTPGSYPVDLEVDPARRQNRWTVVFRWFLAVPALLLFAVIVGQGRGGSWDYSGGDSSASGTSGSGGGAGFGGLISGAAVFAWFAIMALGRVPRGLRNLVLYCLRFAAQVGGYLLILTDRYPQPGPLLPAEAGAPPEHPIELRVEDDLRRSRLTVFFRLLLAIPHFVWLTLWSYAAALAAIASWFATLVMGRSPLALHRFLSAFVRYQTHVYAFVTLVANPFPGFTGRPGSYPIDVEIAAPQPQNRWVTAFRFLLALPAVAIHVILLIVLFVVAFLGWFAALATGRMPEGLRDLGAFALRYSAQASGYGFYLLTDRYPFSGPPAEEPLPAAEPVPGLDPAAGAAPT